MVDNGGTDLKKRAGYEANEANEANEEIQRL